MKKSLLITALVLAFIYSIGGIYFYFFDDNVKPKAVKNISEIKGYDYKLKSTANELMKTEFNILKKNLESNEIDEEAYATSIAKLFIIDLYTMTNKINKYDVGGVDYVFPSGIDNLKLNVTDTIYKYLEDNSNGKRKQELPEVKSITLENSEQAEMKIGEITYPGYKINLNWEYIINLEYDDSGEIIVIKDESKYFIVEKK